MNVGSSPSTRYEFWRDLFSEHRSILNETHGYFDGASPMAMGHPQRLVDFHGKSSIAGWLGLPPMTSWTPPNDDLRFGLPQILFIVCINDWKWLRRSNGCFSNHAGASFRCCGYVLADTIGKGWQILLPGQPKGSILWPGTWWAHVHLSPTTEFRVLRGTQAKCSPVPARALIDGSNWTCLQSRANQSQEIMANCDRFIVHQLPR